jgi:glycine/D-amino acid oxidase-like deaminating enzyme
MARVDLTVRGGGVTGLAIAWEAARRGARVRLIELRSLGAGASGGLVGALAPHTPEQWTPVKDFQLRALLSAPAFWAGVEQASGLPTGYAPRRRWQPLADQAAVDLAKLRIGAAARLWHGQAEWRVIPRPDHPFAPPSPTGYLVEDTLSARLHPRLALAALAAAIRAKGGEVIEGRDAPEEGPVIWATGVEGLVALTPDAGRMGVKGQAASLLCPGFDLAPQVFVDGLHIVPHRDGTVAIGSTSENHWSDPSSTDELLEALIGKARALLPVLADAPVLQRWAGLRPKSASRRPVLGPWPDRPGAFVANGGFKIGFGIAPEVARVMVDLVLEGRDSVPAGFRA